MLYVVALADKIREFEESPGPPVGNPPGRLPWYRAEAKIGAADNSGHRSGGVNIAPDSYHGVDNLPVVFGVKTPEQTRTNATRSRWRGSMLACTL